MEKAFTALLAFVLVALWGCSGDLSNDTDTDGHDIDTPSTEYGNVTAYTWFVNDATTDSDDQPEACLVTVTDEEGKASTGNTGENMPIPVGETCYVHAGNPSIVDSAGNPLHEDNSGQLWASSGDNVLLTNKEENVTIDFWFNLYVHFVADSCAFDRYDADGDYFDTIDCGNPEIEVVEDLLTNYDDPSFGSFILGDREGLEIFGTDVDIISDFEVWVVGSDIIVDVGSGKTVVQVRIETSDGTAKELFIEGDEL